MSVLARAERFLGWSALSPLAIGGLLVTLEASLFQVFCVLIVFAQYSVKIDQIHAATHASPGVPGTKPIATVAGVGTDLNDG